MAAAIKTDLLRPGSKSSHQIGYLRSKRTCSFMVSTRDRRPDKLAGSRFINRLELHANVITLGIFEQDDRTLGGYKKIASRVAQKITEHVARASRISLIERVEQQDSSIICGFHPGAKSVEALTAKLGGIYGRRFAVRKPHAIRRIVSHRVSHRIAEIYLINIVGIEDDDAHRGSSPWDLFATGRPLQAESEEKIVRTFERNVQLSPAGLARCHAMDDPISPHKR